MLKKAINSKKIRILWINEIKWRYGNKIFKKFPSLDSKFYFRKIISLLNKHCESISRWKSVDSWYSYMMYGYDFWKLMTIWVIHCQSFNLRVTNLSTSPCRALVLFLSCFMRMYTLIFHTAFKKCISLR